MSEETKVSIDTHSCLDPLRPLGPWAADAIAHRIDQYRNLLVEVGIPYDNIGASLQSGLLNPALPQARALDKLGIPIFSGDLPYVLLDGYVLNQSLGPGLASLSYPFYQAIDKSFWNNGLEKAINTYANVVRPVNEHIIIRTDSYQLVRNNSEVSRYLNSAFDVSNMQIAVEIGQIHTIPQYLELIQQLNIDGLDNKPHLKGKFYYAFDPSNIVQASKRENKNNKFQGVAEQAFVNMFVQEELRKRLLLLELNPLGANGMPHGSFKEISTINYQALAQLWIQAYLNGTIPNPLHLVIETSPFDFTPMFQHRYRTIAYFKNLCNSIVSYI